MSGTGRIDGRRLPVFVCKNKAIKRKNRLIYGRKGKGRVKTRTSSLAEDIGTEKIRIVLRYVEMIANAQTRRAES